MKFKGQNIFNLVLFFGSVFLFFYASKFPELKHADKLGPDFWPQLVLGVIVILSGILVFFDFLSRRIEKPVTEFSEGKPHTKRLILAIILTLSYGFSVPWLGFLLSIFILQILFLLVLSEKKVIVIVFLPLGLTVSIYLIFIKILYIPLPRGSGVFLQFSRLFY